MAITDIEDLTVRLVGRDDNGYIDLDTKTINNDQFASLIQEYFYGSITRQDIIDAYALAPVAVTKLDVLLNKGGNAADKKELTARLKSILAICQASDPIITGYHYPSDLDTLINAI